MSSNKQISTFFSWFICFLGILFYAYACLLRIAPRSMMTDLATHFQISDLTQLFSNYFIIIIPLQLIAGILLDRFSSRLILTLACLCCVVGTYLFAATPYILIAEIGRLLICIGSAFAFIGVLKLATNHISRQSFAMFCGLVFAIGMLTVLVGKLFLAWFVTLFGWQDTIYFTGAYGIILALLLVFFLRDKNIANQSNQMNLTLQKVLENTLNIIKSQQIWIIGLIGGFMYIPTLAFAEIWGSSFLASMHHLTSDETSTAIAMIFAGWVLGAPVTGFISDTLNRRKIMLIVSALVSAILLSTVLFVPGLSIYDIYALLFAFGLVSSAQVIVFASAKELYRQESSGSAIAFTNMMVMCSGVAIPYFIDRLLNHLWNGQMQNGVQVFTNQNYQVALAVLPIGLILASIFAMFFLKETYCGEEIVTSTTVNNFASER